MVRVTRPVAAVLAGRRWFPVWAVLRHRGRKSGKEYAVPVAPLVGRDSFVIGLPWGPRTNWVQNVIAAGGCTIRWKGVDYRLSDPRVVGVEAALQAAGRFQRIVLKRTRIPAFLELRR
jgi:deazaflavin-dependent oxidoreductase (nitroreductase family)